MRRIAPEVSLYALVQPRMRCCRGCGQLYRVANLCSAPGTAPPPTCPYRRIPSSASPPARPAGCMAATRLETRPPGVLTERSDDSHDCIHSTALRSTASVAGCACSRFQEGLVDEAGAADLLARLRTWLPVDAMGPVAHMPFYAWHTAQSTTRGVRRDTWRAARNVARGKRHDVV